MKKNIVGTDNYIGIDGYVYSCDGHRFCRWIDNVGYYQTTFVSNGKKRYFRIHRLLAEYFLEQKDDCNIVNHIDGNKLNNDISNLEWTTNAKIPNTHMIMDYINQHTSVVLLQHTR
ncbi:MAG: HNH endonuclease [Cetobacterium sp.]